MIEGEGHTVDVAVIGGNRHFGRRLVEELQRSGARVTVINRGSVPAPPGVTHLRADRDDRAALAAALDGHSFDTVIDQVCYTPVQAATAIEVFAGRTRRYVMTSTVEVYAESGLPHPTALPEDTVAPAAQHVDLELPWQDRGFTEARYGEGKRQAEAVLAREAPFDTVFVRTAHVLGGSDFTGRLDHYVERVTSGRPVVVGRAPQPASFVHEAEIARFLARTAAAEFTGAVNAASPGALDARELTTEIGRITGHVPRFVTGEGSEPLSPFSFDRCYALDTVRAVQLGLDLTPVTDWLPGVVKEIQEAHA